MNTAGHSREEAALVVSERGVRHLAMRGAVERWLSRVRNVVPAARVKRIGRLAASTAALPSRGARHLVTGHLVTVIVGAAHGASCLVTALSGLSVPAVPGAQSGNPDNAADRTTGRTGEISRPATGQAPGETIEPVLPWGRSAKPPRALVVGPPNQAAGPASGKRGVNGGPTPREFPRGSFDGTRASAQIFGTARRIAFPSFTNTRYSTSRAWCRSSSSGTWRLRLATTASNESRVVSSLQRRFAST